MLDQKNKMCIRILLLLFGTLYGGNARSKLRISDIHQTFHAFPFIHDAICYVSNGPLRRYNSNIKLCCDKELHPLFNKRSEEMKCCPGMGVYVPGMQVCCGPNLVNIDTLYKHYKHPFCCKGEFHERTKDYNGCCNGHPYNQATMICCSGTLSVRKPGESCCNGQILPLGHTCCKEVKYNTLTSDCCGGTIINKMEQICCRMPSGYIQVMDKGPGTGNHTMCCRNQTYNIFDQKCVEGTLQPKMTEAIDSEIEESRCGKLGLPPDGSCGNTNTSRFNKGNSSGISTDDVILKIAQSVVDRLKPEFKAIGDMIKGSVKKGDAVENTNSNVRAKVYKNDSLARYVK